MSSSDEEQPFLSAQHPQDQIYVAEDHLDSSSAASSDALDREDNATIESVPQVSEVSIDVDDLGSKIAAPEKVGASSEECSPVPPSRPNKFSGPPSTWRNWTAAERSLAASLDQSTAKDLSIHLYNAFMLKKSCSTQAQPHEFELPDADADGPDESVTWTPPKVWTAWPLPPENVPREEERKRWEEAATLLNSSSVKATRSSELMGELLVAQILRKARGRFDDRQSEAQDPEAQDSGASEVRPRKYQSKVSSVRDTDEEAKNLKPVVMTDDDRASQILQPTVQHVMTKIDDILMGFHYARRSYLIIDGAASGSESQINERSTSRRKVRKRKRSASTRDTDVEIASDDASAASAAEAASTRNTMSRSRSQSKRPKSASRKTSSRTLRNRMSRMGCRDWSDVLGVASVTGWPPTVVERAAVRCASLFGEGITFRTLEEGSLAFTEKSYLPDVLPSVAVCRSTKAVAGKGVTNIRKKEEEMVGGVHVDGFLQPIEGKKSWKYRNKGAKNRRTSCVSSG